jgi:hypothetical protein
MNEPLRMRVPAAPPTGVPTSDDTSIPLLTERLTAPETLPPLDLDITLPPSAQTVKLDLPLADTPSPAAPAPTEGAHWSRIEIELRESVLRTLAEQLPRNIEDIVARHVSAATDAAVRAMVEPLIERLAADARLALASSLRDIVDRAVKSELARLRAMRTR